MVADNPRSHHPAGSGAEAGQQCARKRPFEFPILAVDYETQERSVRASAWSYTRIIEEGGFE
jgi:hypothetical protein